MTSTSLHRHQQNGFRPQEGLRPQEALRRQEDLRPRVARHRQCQNDSLESVGQNDHQCQVVGNKYHHWQIELCSSLQQLPLPKSSGGHPLEERIEDEAVLHMALRRS